MVNFVRESDIVKKVQHSTFKLNPIAAAIAVALVSQFPANVAQAGSGWGAGTNLNNAQVKVPTYYANSPVGPVPVLDAAGAMQIDAVTKLPIKVDTGKALRKFVDTLPGFGAAKTNNLGQYIPVAVPEKWVDLNGVTTTDDYIEIAAVEFTEKMHSDLPKATHQRGYVQLSTAKNPGAHIALTYPNGTPVLDANNAQVFAHDKPHHLGPIINATKGTAVRVKFTNYLPLGGELFIPVDTTIPGAGVQYTQNRAEIHLVGGNTPWISAGTPHQWVAPAGETAAYLANLGKGVSNQNVPDMADPGNGSTTLYFPNDLSARFTFYQDRSSGLTRLNSYAGLEAAYSITDNAEKTLIASGAIPAAADTIPLIIEDKTFVPANIAQQDAKWDTLNWGQPGDLWFPHVYEANQDPNSIDGTNPVGRWDWGPWFWPIFPNTTPLPTGAHGDVSFTPEAFMDTPLVNGTAYPTLTVAPKAYRFRMLNASNDRYLNLGLYKADTTPNIAPQLDRNGNPIVNAAGVQQYFTGTEVKMVPATADINGSPLVPTSYADQNCLCQYPNLVQVNNSAPSGPTRAWPQDGRVGGAPDPAAVGPDFIAIGNDGGFLPNPVDIPSQPILYEQNRRSITVSNIYSYGVLLGPSERADTIVDFSAYAGQTLILYNDAPAPVPFNDQRLDYYTGNPDLTGIGGAYSTLPGYGPNIRTVMQIKVSATAPAAPFNADALKVALPAAYGVSQPKPIVPAVAYNNAFGTNDTDIYAHVATGSVAQPTLDFSSGVISITGLNLITSSGAASGSGMGYDPANPPVVTFNNDVNGVSCLPKDAAGNLMPGVASASATAVVDPGTPAVLNPDGSIKTPAVPSTLQVTKIINFNGGSGYTCAPTVTFTNPPGTSGVGAQATVVSLNSSSIPVQTKAEQELFDTSGRYNSTGGIEMPFTNAVNQTTIPLNYIDAATEVLNDGETQIWKIVDNGLFTNSIHFGFVEVQLINRVGWDGTVKAPASNEVGWKDTLRLNPLEDVVLAVRAKRASVPFGLPRSKRLKDPSVAAGALGSGMGFTVVAAAPAGPVTPAEQAALNALTATFSSNTNAEAEYDNEFAWYSAILSHSEDDLMRPIVFHATVVKPDAPTNLTDALGNGKLTWTDPTPAAISLANVQNEIGFKIMQAPLDVMGNAGAFAEVGRVPANVTSWAQPGGAVAGVAYEVVAYNAEGDSAPSTSFVEVAPVAPTTFLAGPVAYNSVTLTWSGQSTTNKLVVTRDGVPIATLAGTANGYVDTTVLAMSTYNYVVTASNAFGSVSTAPLSVTTPMLPVSAPTGLTATPNAAGTSTTVRWTDTANNETAYWVDVTTGATTTRTTITRTAAQRTAINGVVNLTPNLVTAPGNVYTITVTAVNVTGAVTSTSAAVTTTVNLSAPVAPAAPVVIAGVQTATRAPLSWAAVAGATSYVVQVSTNGGAFTSLPQTTALNANPVIAAGNSYSFQVLAQTTKYGLTTQSAASNVVAVMTPPAASTAPVAVAGAPGSRQITVTWTNASSNITAWTVQRRVGGVATTTVATVTNAGATYSFTDTAPAAGNYSYRVTAANAAGTNGPVSAYSAAVAAP